MKKVLILITIFSLNAFGQDIPNENLYSSLGIDFMISEGGIGLGGFFNKDFSSTLNGFIDFSFSESKDDKEFEYVDYWGQVYVVGKKNRVFVMPLNFGLKYRLFKDDIVDNFRPYVNFAFGPAMVITTPFREDFFRAFKYAHAKYTIGGYIGLGAQFGFDRINSVGLNLRYYYVHFFDDGVESLDGIPRKNLGGVYITFNFGFSL
ncbi:MAG: hypothetical protein KJ666_16335 [Bacteroidetes bacterium]|nr:hypothetical protein [Bacteroidota bacterium]MBU2585814.1 hypothetical protein [Bacteroidota bacterium]